MDFSQTQRDPTRRFIGFGAVLLFHIILVYALITGLARKVVEVVKGPIEVKVIEEVIKKPPPPPELLPPPPKLQAPPPPFIPPPEINIQPPPTPAPTITAVTPEAPPAPQAPVIAAPAPAPAPPAVQSAAVVCPNYREALSRFLSARSRARQYSGRGASRIHSRRERADTRHRHQEQHIGFQQARDTNDPVAVGLQRPGAGREVSLPISFKLN